MTRTARTAFAALIALSLSACASGSDDFGDRLVLEGGEVAQIGQDWTVARESIEEGRALIEDGEDDISKGRRQIAKGENRVEEGEDKIKRGERLIRDGERRTAEAERLYEQRRVVPALTRTR